MSNEYENRVCTELRATEEGTLEGYAAVFNSRSLDLGGYHEVIMPGAFTRTLTEHPDVLALVEHDAMRVIARQSNGTLQLEEDAKGLHVLITPNPDVSFARDVVAQVKRGDLSQMSFRFRPYPNGATLANRVRTLSSVELKEVSIVASPAYPASEVQARSIGEGNRNAIARLRLAAL